MNPFDLDSEALRILFKSHYELAEKFDGAAEKVVEADQRLSLLLAGNGDSACGGLLSEIRDAKECLTEALEELRKLNRGYLEQQIVALNAAVEQFPARLMGEFSSREFVGRLQKQIHGMIDERIVAARSTVVKLLVDDMISVCSDVSKTVFGEPAEEAAAKLHLSRLLAEEVNENKRLRDELAGSTPAAKAKSDDAKKRIWAIAAMTTFPAGMLIGLLSGSAAVELLMPFFN